LWSRNQSWARGAANFILANKSWPRDSNKRVRASRKQSIVYKSSATKNMTKKQKEFRVHLENKVRGSTGEGRI